MTSCTARPERTITKTEYIYVSPPGVWMEERKLYEYQGQTNEDLLQYLLDAKEIIDIHNVDKRKLQMWRNTWADEIVDMDEIDEKIQEEE